MNSGVDEVIVHVEHGRLRGLWTNGVASFRGIPYAAPPFGHHRFQPPQAPVSWDGVRDASVFAPVSPQVSRSDPDAMLGGESCLSVNVWTPALEPTRALPVMVWIPGGGFMRGGSSDPLYDGANFARQGVVLVSINYRLGVDGFLHFPDAMSNRGLLDQVAALRWVQQNIAAFGGDPDNVTVFGQSAGAGSIACLLALSDSRNLFQRAILQSPSITVHTAIEAKAVTRAVASLLSVEPTARGFAMRSVKDTVQALAQLAADAGLRRQLGLSPKSFFPVRPVVDGLVLRDLPLEVIRKKWQEDPPGLDLLVGSNEHEMRFYLVPDASIERVSDEQLREFAQAVGVPEAVDVYRSVVGEQAPGWLLCQMQSDYFYRMPACRIATTATMSGLNCYLYEFGWPSPLYDGKLGAAHGVELPFVFNNLPAGAALNFIDSNAPLTLRDEMHKAWAAFARCGNPGWSAFTQQDRGFMHFDSQSRYACVPNRLETAVWNAVRY